MKENCQKEIKRNFYLWFVLFWTKTKKKHFHLKIERILSIKNKNNFYVWFVVFLANAEVKNTCLRESIKVADFLEKKITFSRQRSHPGHFFRSIRWAKCIEQDDMISIQK